jgi:hypothetical protein
VGGELAHGEVVQDQHGGPGELAEPLAPGPVGVAAGEVAEGLGDVALPDADGAVEDGGLARLEPSARARRWRSS